MLYLDAFWRGRAIMAMIFGVAVKFWSGAAAVLEEFLGVDSLVRLR